MPVVLSSAPLSAPFAVAASGKSSVGQLVWQIRQVAASPEGMVSAMVPGIQLPSWSLSAEGWCFRLRNEHVFELWMLFAIRTQWSSDVPKNET